MNDKIRDMMNDIEEMKKKLLSEIQRHEKNVSYEIQNGYVRFEKEVVKKQKENMKNILAYLKDIPLLHFMSSPIIYGMIIPAVLFDMILFAYQNIIFRIYKFEFVKRSDYIIFDRHYLGYLNFIEKLNCMYCSYFNGLMHYAAAIAGRTELYFCPIKHAKKIVYEHTHYKDFLVYGDDEYQNKLKELRDKFQIR